MVGGRIVGLIPFPKVIKHYVKCKQPHPESELELLYPFFTMVTIALRSSIQIALGNLLKRLKKNFKKDNSI